MKRTLHKKGLLQRQNKGWLYILPWMLGPVSYTHLYTINVDTFPQSGTDALVTSLNPHARSG